MRQRSLVRRSAPKDNRRIGICDYCEMARLDGIVSPAPRTARADEIIACARLLIEKGEGDRLTMRRLADELGIQAPSLYKHFADKEAITTALHVDYLAAQRDALRAALVGEPDEEGDLVVADAEVHPLLRVARAYREHARDHPEQFRFVFLLPYPDVPELLTDIRRQWFRAAGDDHLALAAYGLSRGVVEMEVFGQVPRRNRSGAGFEAGIRAIIAQLPD